MLVAVLFGFQVFKPWAALLNPTNMDRKEDIKRLEAIWTEVDGARGWLPAPEFRDDLDRDTRQMVNKCEARLHQAMALLRAEIERRQLW